MLRSLHFSLFGLSLGALLFLLLSTRPDALPAYMLMLPFILLFVTIFLIASFVLRELGLPKPKPRRAAALLAAFPTVLLVLQSIGQLTTRDVLTVSTLFMFAYFYLTHLKIRINE